MMPLEPPDGPPVKRRGRSRIWLGRLLLFGAIPCVIFGLALFILRDQRRVVAEARSRDGAWGVAIVGQKMFFGLGGIEVIVEVRDGEGRPLPGGFVIGASRDWSEAREKFGQVSCDGPQARAGRVTIQRKDYLGW